VPAVSVLTAKHAQSLDSRSSEFGESPLRIRAFSPARVAGHVLPPFLSSDGVVGRDGIANEPSKLLAQIIKVNIVQATERAKYAVGYRLEVR
jgi:hypothetical protein